ncbi:hypothetical protein [Siccibacter turicensis]|uniref:hypothetical protein n=1 Tax=Siccibacter turicensis TaxID=357233 RepID=UPI001EEFEAFF|nr:hypothetical protein [Siccibacter turicensis]
MILRFPVSELDKQRGKRHQSKSEPQAGEQSSGKQQLYTGCRHGQRAAHYQRQRDSIVMPPDAEGDEPQKPGEREHQPVGPEANLGKGNQT